jgi:hypothetical protein
MSSNGYDQQWIVKMEIGNGDGYKWGFLNYYKCGFIQKDLHHLSLSSNK